jgi:purine-cytosine permease-like protein
MIIGALSVAVLFFFWAAYGYDVNGRAEPLLVCCLAMLVLLVMAVAQHCAEAPKAAVQVGSE